jgi:5'-methylthioadenosine phosphorylase
MDDHPVLAILGGTGLYAMPDLTDVREIEIDTPFGKPSSPVVIGQLMGKQIAFIARHGKGHVLQPSEINFRANIFALKMIGVDRILSVNAVGSLREDYSPGDIVIPDQLFDFTKDRKRTFFGDGIVAHISVADPFCKDLSARVAHSFTGLTNNIHTQGTFLTVEGPRFSTKAESLVFRTWGMSILGMNTAPEAFLAREAEICFTVMAHVTDYDVWHSTEEPVTVDVVIERLSRNVELTRSAIRNLVQNLSSERVCDCQTALANAIITSPEQISSEVKKKFGILINKYIS